MSSTIHGTFESMTVSGFRSYAETLVARYPTSEQRKQAVSYLQGVSAAEKTAYDKERDALRTKRVQQRKRQQVIDELLSDLEFDFSRTPTLFQAQAVTDSAILTLLTQDDNEVFISRNITGDVTISGNRVLFDGSGNEGSAVGGLLVNQSTITGTLKISGDDIKIKNLDFISTGENALEITGTSKNLTLENCTFTAPVGHTDSKWWYHASNNGKYSGDVTITNCKVQNFTSPLLADFSTSSAVATTALRNVRITKSHFLECQGSVAARGQVSVPMRLFHVKDCVFKTSTFATLFWDFIEASGAVLKVDVRDNSFEGEAGTHTAVGKKGVAQFWSKNAQPWKLNWKNNDMKNVKVGLKVVCHTGFYSPIQDSDDAVVSLDGTNIDVAWAMSMCYKKVDGTTASADKYQLGDYVPVNASVWPAVVVPVNPNSYPVVAARNL